MLIDYKNATICQQDGKVVLENVNFTADEGSFIYITGRVGSGKSSLLKTFYKELDIEKAESAIVLDCDMLSIKSKDIPALRRQMGIVFQDFQLLTDRTVHRNLQFVLKSTGWKNEEKIEARIEEVLKVVGMYDKIECMPHELSGGEQQRIAIARAILNSPKLIVADEPTANLDPDTAKGIMELLYGFSLQNTAVVMSTHNLQLLEQFPGIVYHCEDNQIIKEQ